MDEVGSSDTNESGMKGGPKREGPSVSESAGRLLEVNFELNCERRIGVLL